jgi:lantibiotic modifying enzyme
MSGCSGTLLGLVSLIEQLDESWLGETALSLGEELIARAETAPEGWSWPAPGSPGMENLCGYSHGAAGIAHALLELFDLTGDARFAMAGDRAFDYERHWLSRGNGMWPDLRGVGRGVGRDAPLSGSCSWCNGASGILLSRLRATVLSPSPEMSADAQLALAACERHASELLGQAPADFSICHGGAAISDVLLEAGNGLDGANDCVRLASELGRWGIEGARHTGGFACGVPEGETPGLLLGFAGIGLLFLRLADPAVESALIVRPKRLTARVAGP